MNNDWVKKSAKKEIEQLNKIIAELKKENQGLTSTLALWKKNYHRQEQTLESVWRNNEMLKDQIYKFKKELSSLRT